MGIFSDQHEDSYNELQNTHSGHITHDLLGGGVAYEAAKAWEDHCAKNGKPDSHAKAKEILAGLVGAGLTRLVETKGLNAWDAHKQKAARDHAETQVNETILVNEYDQC
ncbi:Protein of unknown function (DUF3759) domain containing protein [Tylopilus felleus]